jgi:3-hydroxyacyl-CoA dehydrogenase
MDLAGLEVHAAVAAALFPRLCRDRTVPELLARAVRNGALGAERGAGLRGTYSPAEAAEQVQERDRVLAARMQARRRRDRL